MRWTVFTSLILIALLSGCRKSKFDSEHHTLRHDGEKREYLLHIPDAYTGNDPVSLVLALHGGTGSAKNIESQSGLPDFSDEMGFIACFPEGMHRTWNAGDCCGKASKKDVDDVGFISKLIDELLDEYNIDPNRVYVTGMSNGGFMSYRLACELSDKIAAIAPVAGSFTAENCDPNSPVSIIHFHSELDENIPSEGGTGDGLSEHYNPPLDSVFTIWAGFNDCMVLDSAINDIEGVTHRIWTACNNSTAIEYYLTSDGGHSWPGGTRPRSKADDTSELINANELMWDFFQRHPKQD